MSILLTREGYFVKKRLLKNADYTSIVNDLFITPRIPNSCQTPVSYSILRETDKYVILPKYYGIQRIGAPNGTLPLLNINVNFLGSLRENQKKIIDNIMPKITSTGGGLLSLPCGYGKTIITLRIIANLNVKTIILVHKSFLLEQWRQRIQEFTNAKVGIIKQSKIIVDGMDVVIGMIQSISMRDYDKNIFADFGLVVVDECHHIASRVFSRALSKITTKYTLGLSATPERNDGLTYVIKWYLGEMLHSEETGCNIGVNVHKIMFETDDPKFIEQTQWSPSGNVISVSKMVSSLSQIIERNDMIVSVIKNMCDDPTRKILILSGRLEQLQYLKCKTENCIDNKIISYYIGSTTEEQRRNAEQFADIIFATYDMAQEGFDVPRLNTLIMATPKKNIIQSIGRVMRKPDAKTNPIIVDIFDNLSIFIGQGKKRMALYNKNRYNIFVCDHTNIKHLLGNSLVEHQRDTKKCMFSDEV